VTIKIHSRDGLKASASSPPPSLDKAILTGNSVDLKVSLRKAQAITFREMIFQYQISISELDVGHALLKVCVAKNDPFSTISPLISIGSRFHCILLVRRTALHTLRRHIRHKGLVKLTAEVFDRIAAGGARELHIAARLHPLPNHIKFIQPWEGFFHPDAHHHTHLAGGHRPTSEGAPPIAGIALEGHRRGDIPPRPYVVLDSVGRAPQ